MSRNKIKNILETYNKRNKELNDKTEARLLGLYEGEADEKLQRYVHRILYDLRDGGMFIFPDEATYFIQKLFVAKREGFKNKVQELAEELYAPNKKVSKKVLMKVIAKSFEQAERYDCEIMDPIYQNIEDKKHNIIVDLRAEYHSFDNVIATITIGEEERVFKITYNDIRAYALYGL